MPNEAAVSEFDRLMAELLSSPEADVEVVDPGTEPEPTPAPVLKLEAIQQVVASPKVVVSVPEPRWRTDDGKQEIPVNGPFKAVMYSKGYLNLVFGQSWNKCSLYRKKFMELREFFRSAECDELIAKANAAGWKDELVPKKKGG